MELVDMQDLGSCAARRVGSSPFIRTTNKNRPSGLFLFVRIKRRGLKGERWERRRWRMKRPERVAAVDKIEEKRKPEDFIGHRKRTPAYRKTI